jgi:hypothetical protein
MLREAEAVLGEGSVRLGGLSVKRAVEEPSPTGKVGIGRRTEGAEAAQALLRSSADVR